MGAENMNLAFGYVGVDASERSNSIFEKSTCMFPEACNQEIAHSADRAAYFYISQPKGYYPLERPVWNVEQQQLFMLNGYFWYKNHFPITEFDAVNQLSDAALDLTNNGIIDLGRTEGGVFTFYVYDQNKQVLHIFPDYSGLSPCYYSLTSSGIFFSNHIRHLSEYLESPIDHVGIMQKTAFHYTIGKRTVFSNINCLMPGELLAYNIQSNQITLFQPKTIYSTITRYKSDIEAADAIYSEFVHGVSELSRPAGLRGILLSGGNDSRFVAKGFRDHNSPITSIVIGNENNKEVKLAIKVAKVLDSEIRVVNPISDCQLNSASIQELMRGAESVNFTHFLSPGKLLAELGAISVSTGYGGDTLLAGNGYALLGDIYSNKNRFKLGLLRSLGYAVNFSAQFSTFGYDKLNELIRSFYGQRISHSEKWFRKEWTEENKTDTISATYEDIAAEIKRIRSSNPESPFQVIERFWREHQERYTGGILSTLYNYLPLSLPTMHPKFVELCSNLSPQQKVDNGIYQLIIKQQFGELAKIPTGSTPLPTTYPSLVLLLARVFRSLDDNRIIKRQIETKGKTKLQRYGWPNFEDWFRHGPFLENSKSYINYDIYSKEYLDQKIARWINWDERLFSGQELLTLITISQLLSQ